MRWAIAEEPFPGEEVSGDAGLVLQHPGGTLIAAIDGLGHGPHAHHAATLASDVLRKHATETAESLVLRCHDALMGTRGVALSLATTNADEDTLQWVGVGNVAGVLCHSENGAPKRQNLVNQAGVVGYHIPTIRPQNIRIAPRDLLILASDGIRSSFAEDLPTHATPPTIARHIRRHHARGTDDAVVLVARMNAE